MVNKGLQPLNIFFIIFPFAISLVVVGIRVWRRVKEHKYAIDDTLLVIAEALIAVLTATVWKYIVVSYSGYKAENIPEGAVSQTDVLKWRYVNNAIYNPILGLVKISFLITLLKLKSPNILITISLWALIAINALYILAATFGSIFMCWPVKKYWYPTEPGTCGHRAQYIFGVIAVSIITDVLVTAIPAWILHDFQMLRRTKLIVLIFLSLPLAVTAIAIYRLYTFVVVFSLPTLSAEDPYNVRNALSNVESNLAVIAVCGPTIKWILGCFVTCFRAGSTRPSNVYTPNKSSRLQAISRKHHKDGDIKFREDHFSNESTVGISSLPCKSNDNDAESYEQYFTKEDGIKKTVVADWNFTELRVPSEISVPGTSGEDPRPMV